MGFHSVSFDTKAGRRVFYIVWIPLFVVAIFALASSGTNRWTWFGVQIAIFFIAAIAGSIADGVAKRKHSRQLDTMISTHSLQGIDDDEEGSESEIENDTLNYWEWSDEEEDEEEEKVQEGKRLIEEYLENECSQLLKQINSIGWGPIDQGKRELMFSMGDTRYAIEFTDQELVGLSVGHNKPIKKAEQFIRAIVTSGNND
jgi:hypothetical protein